MSANMLQVGIDRPFGGCSRTFDRPTQGCNQHAQKTAISTIIAHNVEAKPTNLDDTLFVIGTACEGGNVVKDPALLDQLTRSAAKVTGVSGHETKISHMGELPLAGRSVMMEGAVRTSSQ